jgi:aspartokinase
MFVQITVVMKFGGSSLASAERMREVASIICSFPDQYPCVVLSAMGKVSIYPHSKCISFPYTFLMGFRH